MYCIGKASRYKSGDIVLKPPYEKEKAEDVYDLLRSAVYSTRQQATLACDIAEYYNPVGFVVLELDANGIQS